MSAPMTVGDLLGIQALRLVQLAGPAAASRSVRWAHATELPCPSRYLRGGELILTVGSALTTPAACEAFVQDVASASVAAVALGIGDVHVQAPAALLEACDRHGVPLLAMAHGVPFQSLTELIADHRVSTRLAGVRRSSLLVARLLDAMVQGSPASGSRTSTGQNEPGPPEAALLELAAELGGRLEVLDADGLVEFAAGFPGPGEPVAVDLPGSGSGQLLWHPAEGTGAETRTVTRDLLDELAHPLAVWRHERAQRQEGSERDLGRLLRLVLDGRAEPSALAEWLDPSGSVVATAWRPEVAARLRTAFPGRPLAALEEHLVLFLPDPAPAVELAGRTGAACGLGEPVGPADVARSVRQATAALELSCSRGRPVAARELATVDALLDHLPEERLRPFIEQLLAPLFEHDRITGSDLVGTLRAYLEGGAAVIPVARSLFVHPNTLRHRLGRVAEVTGRSPFVLGDRVAFVVALRIADRTAARTAERKGTRPRQGLAGRAQPPV